MFFGKPSTRPDGALLRALTCNSSGPNSAVEGDSTCGLSLLLVLFSDPRGFSLGITFYRKNQHFQVPF